MAEELMIASDEGMTVIEAFDAITPERARKRNLPSARGEKRTHRNTHKTGRKTKWKKKTREYARAAGKK